MRKLFYLGLGLMTVYFTSCQKDGAEPEPDIQKAHNYFPLEIGNYWIYSNYEIDTLGNEKDMNKKDSVIISRDTTIRGNQYYILEGLKFPNNVSHWSIIDILRDSSGYLVDDKGGIKFSATNFKDTLYTFVQLNNEDTLYTLTYKMEKSNSLVTVPAGEFKALNFKGTVFTPFTIKGIKNPRYIDNYYAENVGKIFQTYFYMSSQKTFEKRLIRYKIENSR